MARSIDKQKKLNLHLFVKLASELTRVVENESNRNYMREVGQAVNSLMDTHKNDLTSTQVWEVSQTVVLFLLSLFGMFQPFRIFHRQQQASTTQQDPSSTTAAAGENIQMISISPPPSGQQLVEQA